MLSADLSRADEDRLWRFRNLGKALYENPTTQQQAVDEFRKARDLAPNSTREIINYGLALLRAGDVAGGIAQLEKAQKLDPKIPHTWFNLGIAFKKQAEFDRALPQLQEMARLVPTEPVVHYQLGALQKLANNLPAATAEFERARDLNPRLAAPHFQLFGIYRQANRPEDAAAELAKFQELKKQQEGAAVPEDMEWTVYSEIYDAPPAPPAVPPSSASYQGERLAAGFGGENHGTLALSLDGGVRPSLIAWGNGRAALFRNGTKAVTDSGLEDLRNVVSIAAGDFDNDGLPDLAVVTTNAALLYRNVGGRFQREGELARGSFRKAVWLDYDHDYDPDLFLVGDDSRLLRNNGPAGFSDESKRFPFVAGKALDAVRFDLEPDTPGFDLVVSYADRPGVLYRDALGGTYTAHDIPELPAGADNLRSGDANHDGRTDLAVRLPDAKSLLLANREGNFQADAAFKGNGYPFVSPVDFDGKGKGDSPGMQDGTLYLGRNVTTPYGNWVELALTGVKNAKLAVGAQIEIKAGMDYHKVTYEGIPVVVRLGGRTQIDTVRITWPNGLIQNETKVPVNRLTTIKEAPRLSGSCPMIFTWNGEGFEFITDVLGVAPLGASSGDGQYFPVDHDEYVSIPGEALKPRDGEYEIRVTEELREVSYLDQIRLLALDHPADTQIVTNEKFKSPPFPEFRLFGVEQRLYPVAAHDQQGADVRTELARRDRIYPDSFRRDQTGVAEMHHLDLDFGKAAQRQSRRPDPQRLGGLGRRQHLPLRHAGPQRSDLPLPAGEGCRRQLEDRGRGHGNSLGQAEDYRGGSHRQVSLRFARSPHRHQSLRVLGRDLPDREQRAARDASYPRADHRRGPAFPRLLKGYDPPRTQAARGVRLRERQRYFHVEPHRRQLHALRRQSKNCSPPRRSHGHHGLRRRSDAALQRRRAAGVAGAAGSATSCCWWTAGPRTPTPIRRFRKPFCPCRSTR